MSSKNNFYDFWGNLFSDKRVHDCGVQSSVKIGWKYLGQFCLSVRIPGIFRSFLAEKPRHVRIFWHPDWFFRKSLGQTFEKELKLFVQFEI